MCNLHNPGHIENYKQHTADLQLVALFLSHLVLVQFFGSQTQAGWWCVLLGSSLRCFSRMSAEIWSLNGKITRIVSSVYWDGDKSCWWSQTFESTKLLMVELMRCLGYFKRENTVFKRAHSSEKCDQDEDKRYARSSIVLSKSFLGRLSTWLW